MRNLVIEHNIIGKETGDELPSVICDGADWGEDFDAFASNLPEDPITYEQDEGFNKATQQWVTYHQTFLRTDKSDEELLEIYDTGFRRVVRRHMSFADQLIISGIALVAFMHLVDRIIPTP